MRNGPAARSFGGYQGGSVSASPQRAVLAEPTQAAAKRTVEGLFPIFRQALRDYATAVKVGLAAVPLEMESITGGVVVLVDALGAGCSVVGGV